MNESAEVLLEMYKMQVDRSVHYETQRVSVVNILFVVTSILLSIAAFDHEFTGADVWLGVTLTSLGIFGLAASLAHGRRSKRHGERAQSYRNALDEAVPDARINEVRSLVPSTSTRLNLIWNLFPVFVVALGLVITFMAAGN